MGEGGSAPSLPEPTTPAPDVKRSPVEMPVLLVRHSRVLLPTAEGPQLVLDANEKPLEVFEAFDRLTPVYRRIYIVDLDGVEGGEPQLDLWPELAREADLWIDGGVETADQAIDILVAGARRAVLSSSRLRSSEELAKSWALSQELAFEIELRAGSVVAREPLWAGGRADQVASKIRTLGPQIIVVSPRGDEVDWDQVALISEGGSTYVDGSYPKGSLNLLADAGARGGIFHPKVAELLPVDQGEQESVTGELPLPDRK
jgi:hypothetical protein